MEIGIKISYNFGASSKNIGHKQYKEYPQEQSGALKIILKARLFDDAPHRTKNSINGQIPTVLGTAGNKGNRNQLPTKPNGRASKRKIKDEHHLRYASTGENKCMSAWPQMNLR